MIEILNGIKETIRYEDIANLRLFHNTDYEDYPKHWHVGIEVIMPVSNYYNVIIDDVIHHVPENDIIFINSGVIHSLQAPPSGERIILQFDLSLLYTLKEFDTTLFMLPPALTISPDTHPKEYPIIHSMMQEIVKEYDSDNALKEAAVCGYLIQIYVLLCRNEMYCTNKFRNITSTKQHEYIEKLLSTCDYINQHFQEDLNLEHVAGIAGFSKFHFSRLFKEFTNVTFHAYLNRRRIMHAETLLLDANLSVLDVCMGSGFTSISTFNRIFKQLKGCSPNDYRKRRTYDTPHL